MTPSLDVWDELLTSPQTERQVHGWCFEMQRRIVARERARVRRRRITITTVLVAAFLFGLVWPFVPVPS